MEQSNTKSHQLNDRQQLRGLRVEQGLSLRELAYFAGCSHTTIARLERGDLDVAPALKAKIARALRVPVGDLWSPEEVA
jgi:DNA-binding XRE family transcriptional regulator